MIKVIINDTKYKIDDKTNNGRIWNLGFDEISSNTKINTIYDTNLEEFDIIIDESTDDTILINDVFYKTGYDLLPEDNKQITYTFFDTDGNVITD